MDAKKVLDFFKEITLIPRESGHEEPMTAYLQKFAADRGLECRTDETGNVLIVKQAAPGKENVPALVLQAHQDMVCEKVGGYVHDFAKDPISYEIEDGWMIAKNTTLGADDGIGIAACLALLDGSLSAGRLECLFTISEETGMDGAFALKSGFFDGKTLINLDSEDEGQLFVGCAGGLDTFAKMKISRVPLAHGTILKLRIFNAQGGHSGDDINKERANTLQLLCRFLYSEKDWQLLSLSGGNKPNAICREAEAVICTPDPEKISEAFTAFGKTLAAEFAVSDSGISVEVAPCSCGETAIAEGRQIVSTLFALPHGVAAMSMDIPGLVETSTNLAAVRMAAPDVFEVITSQRSSVTSELHAIAAKVEACFLLGGFEVEHHSEYPGWKPDMNSRILDVCVRSYRRLFNTEPEVKAIHAGLECGLFLEKFPDLDMISFGPTLRGVHAPGEKLELASLDKFWALLEDVVCNFE